jgi:hypothetical protein
MLIFILLLSLSHLLQAKIEVFFTEPKCLNDQNKITLYCDEGDDEVNYHAFNTPKNKIRHMIKDPNTRELWIAMFDISEPEILATLCDKLKFSDLKLKILMNHSKNSAFLNELVFCAKNNKQASVKLNFHRPDKYHNLFHMKFLLFNPNGLLKEQKILFSSGNLTKGTYLKHENWNLLSESKINSQLINKHKCVFEAFENSVSKKSEYREFFEKCTKNELIDKDLEIESFFIPGEGQSYLNKLQELIQNSNKIIIASHRITLKPAVIMLKNFLKRGGKLTIYADRDFFTSVIDQKTFKTKELIYLLQFYSLGAQIIAVNTNTRHSSLFHHKFILFDQARTKNAWAMLNGSGNLTISSLLEHPWKIKKQKISFSKKLRKTNFENFYFIENEKVSEIYRDYLYKMPNTPINFLLKK